MARRSRLFNLFSSRAPRTSPSRRANVEALEDRVVLNSYTAANAAELATAIELANASHDANVITLTAPNSSPYELSAVSNGDGATGLPVIAAGNNLTIVGDGDTIGRSAVDGTP